jgi:GRAS domain family
MERSFYDAIGVRYPHSSKNQFFPSRPKKDPKSTIFLLEDQATMNNPAQNLMVDKNILASEFQMGVKEGIKFLPTIHKLTVDLQHSSLSSDSEQRVERRIIEFRPEEEDNFRFINRSKGNKDSSNADVEISEGGNRKKPMIHYEETIRDEMYDKVLLNQGENYEKEEISALREIMQHKASSSINKKIQEHVDLDKLLIHCSEAVSINNHQLAEGLLMQIRLQCSRTGDGTQRLACILADGLEARLAGSGSELYRQLVAKRINSTDILRSYHLCIRADPFYRISYSFSNNKILKVFKNASRVHIIDMGICYGFQWPPLIQSLATRQGGPPKLRITGIDFPQRGFRPAKLLEEIGKRLEEYARSFDVSFEYQGIASEWDSIRIDDLNVREDEVCIVNSTIKFSQVRDETYNLESPRSKVLNLIRQIKPQLFIQGIYSATFSSFFTQRFRQVLSQFSMEFDIRDSLIPRDNEQR